MGNIISINFKTALAYKWHVLTFAAFVIVLSTAIAVVASQFWHGQTIPKIYVAIVDLDNSFESLLILSSVQATEEYEDLIEFVISNEDAAAADLLSGAITAIVTFPYRFGNAMATGENMPFLVAYNQNTPLLSAIVRIVADSFADMLMYSQMGVYTTLNYAALASLQAAQFNQVFWGVNLQFLELVLERHNIFYQELITPQQIPLSVSYFIAAYIALLICAFFILSDIVATNFGKHNIIKLMLHGEKIANIILGCAVVYFTLLCFINILLFGMLTIFGVLELSVFITVGVIAINLTISMFGVAVTFLFTTPSARGIFMAFFVIVSLFLSGGIVPLEFSNAPQYLAYATFNYWGARTLGSAYLGHLNTLYLMQLALFSVFFFSVSYAKLGMAKPRGPRGVAPHPTRGSAP